MRDSRVTEQIRTVCSVISCCSLNITLVRTEMGVSDQLLKALAAESEAAFISSWVARGTRVTNSWVALR